MVERSIDDQVTKYLTDAHGIETQALQQLRMAPQIAGEDQLAAVLRAHLSETERHEQLVRDRLEVRGAEPSRLKEIVMRAGGAAFVLFARSQPDTPGKLAAHAFSYEHLELAAYELLRRVAERAADAGTAETASEIRDEERAMADRLAQLWDATVEASLRDVQPSDLSDQLLKYLADAHAIEAQALQLLERGPKIIGDPELARVLQDHLVETRVQQQLVRTRLEALGGSPSRLKDAAMRLGALNWGLFFQAHPDTPGKLAAFAYAFEHLEIGAYEQLARVARRAADDETHEIAERILREEQAAAGKLASSFDRAADASLEAQAVRR